MHPHDALTEIATLLERERSSRYKSKAFRTAADAIDGLSDEQLRDAATLRRRKGIGDSTFAVIQEALEGRVPAYLVDLRERAGVERTSALRGMLRGDLHSHSEWSDGLTSIDLMVEAARALGHEYLALTDHSPRLRVANGLSAERLRAQLEIVAGMSGDGFTLLSGIEVDILEEGGLDQEPALLEELDVVVASAHSKLRMERGPMTRRLVRAVSSGACRRARTRHRPARRGLAGHAAAIGDRCEGRVRGVRRARRRGRDQLAAGAPGPSR